MSLALLNWTQLGLGITRLHFLDDDTEAFHAAAVSIVKNAAARGTQAAAGVDPDLKPEVGNLRRRAAFEIAKANGAQAIQKELDRTLGRRVAAAREIVGTKMQEGRPTDPAEAMAHVMRVQDARSQIQALPLAQRHEALKRMAEAGDARLPDVINDAVSPLVPDPEPFLSAWASRVGGPAGEYLAASEAALDECRDTAMAGLSVVINRAGTQVGLNMSKTIPTAALLDALPPAQKAKLTAALGPAGLQDVANGARPLADVASLLG